MKKRFAFTLIELMIAIVILSVIMVFLYKSYSELNLHVKIYDAQIQKLKEQERLKKVLFLDFSLMLKSSSIILNQDKDSDVVFFQTKHSIHGRINPYVAYILKDQKLYRLESLTQLRAYPLDGNVEFDVDEVSEMNHFRVYKALQKKEEFYLIDAKPLKAEPIILKVRALES